MDIRLESLKEGSAIIDSACMVQEAAQYADVLKDYFFSKAQHLTQALAGYNGESEYCQKTYKIEDASPEDILDALKCLSETLDYIEHKDERFETAVSLELQCSSKGETMEELEEEIFNRHFELLGIGELLTLKSQTTGLFLPEFTELFERYGVE